MAKFVDSRGDHRCIWTSAQCGIRKPSRNKDSGQYWYSWMEANQTGVTTRVSLASDGSEADNSSWDTSTCADGRYAAFESTATNLVPEDRNNRRDIFVHNRNTGETTRVSVASDGTEGNGESANPTISADGRYVAFQSMATNLVPGDTNNASDIFRHDRQTGQTERVSISACGAQSNHGSWDPSISGDGKYIAFRSYASNLLDVPGGDRDTNGRNDIYLRDMNPIDLMKQIIGSPAMAARRMMVV
jgi:Tol biopolymer transport system component